MNPKRSKKVDIWFKKTKTKKTIAECFRCYFEPSTSALLIRRIITAYEIGVWVCYIFKTSINPFQTLLLLEKNYSILCTMLTIASNAFPC